MGETPESLKKASIEAIFGGRIVDQVTALMKALSEKVDLEVKSGGKIEWSDVEQKAMNLTIALGMSMLLESMVDDRMKAKMQ